MMHKPRLEKKHLSQNEVNLEIFYSHSALLNISQKMA